MKELQIDIFGKAPSLVEIEINNKLHSSRGRIFLALAIFLIVHNIVMIILDYSALLPSGFYWLKLFGAIFSLVLIIIAYISSVGELSMVEEFMSTNDCIHLEELIDKYSEVALYRDQVVAQGREFLDSEYEACVMIKERLAYRNIYRINDGMVSINNTA